jgi:hypothetical protein
LAKILDCDFKDQSKGALMSPRSVEEIVADYFTCLTQGCDTGKLNLAKLHFAEDILVVGAHKRIEGRANVLKYMQEKLIPHLQKIVINHRVFDKQTECTIVDFITKEAHETVPAAILHKVKDGVIYEIHFFYDSAKWAKGIGLRKAG